MKTGSSAKKDESPARASYKGVYIFDFLSSIEKSANEFRYETLLHRIAGRLSGHATSQSSW
jgi:hypothetical protein